jgi:CRP-like cAMP-binding protein
MPNSDVSALAPVVGKLTRRSLLGPVEIDALLALPHRVMDQYAASYIVREGDQAVDCVALLSGFAHRSKTAGDGGRQILSIHLRGDLLDLQNGLLDRADHSVQALSAVRVAYIPHRAILDLAAAYPAIARALWRDTLVDGSIFREWIVNVGKRNARQRISHLLCELAVRQEAAGLCKPPRYGWPMTQEQIGDATGLTSVHVNRTLQGMRSDGLLSTDSRSVTITDWSRLQAEGDFNRAYLHEAEPLTP